MVGADIYWNPEEFYYLILLKKKKAIKHVKGINLITLSMQVTEDMLKGTLYLVNSEKFMFFYSW